MYRLVTLSAISSAVSRAVLSAIVLASRRTFMNAKIPAKTKAMVTAANSAAAKAKAIEMLVGQSIPKRLGYGEGIGPSYPWSHDSVDYLPGSATSPPAEAGHPSTMPLRIA